ncbi:MAG TPA: hypothetical protein VMV47_05265 [Bacteroidales bacterium]|nr:hypothetical protein [Bacteroidales bacterium]
METSKKYNLKPGFSNAFGAGWQVMKDNFLRLFLVVIVLAIISGPYKFINFDFNAGDLHGAPWNWNWHDSGNWEHMFGMASLGIFAAFFALIAGLYVLLVAPVFQFGGDMIFVQAARRVKPDFEYFIKGFMENYLSIILANLLVVALVVLGLFALLIPGIIIGCRLVFVSYIVMDKKLDPIEAVELSWKMTRGHGWKIFFMGIVSFFIIIFGLALVIVGIFPAIIWVSSSFASLYESVNRQMENPIEAEVVVA